MLICYTQTACCLAVLFCESQRLSDASCRSAAWKTKVDTEYFLCQEAVSRKPCFRRPFVRIFFFLYFGVDSPPVVFARHFFLPYMVRFFLQVCTEAKNLDVSLVSWGTNEALSRNLILVYYTQDAGGKVKM